MSGWQKGQSGNPKGRPPKSRALAKLLEKEGGRRADAKLPRNKELFAQKVWEGLTTGRITFGEGDDKVTIPLEASDYIQLTKTVLSHLDGPPPQSVEVSGRDGGAIQTVSANVAVTDENVERTAEILAILASAGALQPDPDRAGDTEADALHPG